MTGSRLNHLLMIHIYKEEFDEMGMKLMMNKFIEKKKSRTAIFALFQLWAFVCFSLLTVTV